MSIINNKMKIEVAEKLTENFQKELYKLQVYKILEDFS